MPATIFEFASSFRKESNPYFSIPGFLSIFPDLERPCIERTANRKESCVSFQRSEEEFLGWNETTRQWKPLLERKERKNSPAGKRSGFESNIPDTSFPPSERETTLFRHRERERRTLKTLGAANRNSRATCTHSNVFLNVVKSIRARGDSRDRDSRP